jgi:hypothetical protein
MIFFRRKDLADVEAVPRHPPAGLDLDVVRTKLVELVGKGDERVREWDAIVSDVADSTTDQPFGAIPSMSPLTHTWRATRNW